MNKIAFSLVAILGGVFVACSSSTTMDMDSGTPDAGSRDGQVGHSRERLRASAEQGTPDAGGEISNGGDDAVVGGIDCVLPDAAQPHSVSAAASQKTTACG